MSPRSTSSHGKAAPLKGFIYTLLLTKQYSLIPLQGRAWAGKWRQKAKGKVQWSLMLKRKRDLAMTLELLINTGKVWMKMTKKSTQMLHLCDNINPYVQNVSVTIKILQYSSGYLLYCQHCPVLKIKSSFGFVAK